MSTPLRYAAKQGIDKVLYNKGMSDFNVNIYHSPYGDIVVGDELADIYKSRFLFETTSEECIELEAALDLLSMISYKAGFEGQIKPLFK